MTLRSAVLGIVVVMAIVMGAPYSIWMVRSSEITWSYFPTSAGFCFVVILLANALVRWARPAWALRPAELAIIVIMGLAATGIPTFIVGTLLAIISSPYYGATPENDWAGNIHPYLPDWIVPRADGDAMRWFYEGLPKGQALPFDVWIGPLFWLLSLILTVYFACFCLVVIFRRQWVEHERLVFPLMEMPRLLIDDDGRAIVRSKVFWIGAAIPLGMILFNIIGSFYIGFPKINFNHAVNLQLSREFPTISLMLYFPVIGFMYLVSTSVSFSIVFFYLVAVLQEGITNRIGYDVTRPDAFVWGMQSLSWQAWGGFTAMVLLSLWMARGHLVAVVRQALGGRRTIDDREEMVSYRTAVCGFMAALVYILGWLWRSGMDLHIAVLFVFGVLVAYYGITRLVVQAGVYFLTPPVGAQAFALGDNRHEYRRAQLGGTGGFLYLVRGCAIALYAGGSARCTAWRIVPGSPVDGPGAGHCCGRGIHDLSLFCSLAVLQIRRGQFRLLVLYRRRWCWRHGVQRGDPSFQRSLADRLEQAVVLWDRHGGVLDFGFSPVSLSLVAAAPGGHCGSPAVDDPTHCVFGFSGVGGQECDYALWGDCGLSPSAAVFYGADRWVFLGDWVVVFGGYFLVYGRGARLFSRLKEVIQQTTKEHALGTFLV